MPSFFDCISLVLSYLDLNRNFFAVLNVIRAESQALLTKLLLLMPSTAAQHTVVFMNCIVEQDAEQIEFTVSASFCHGSHNHLSSITYLILSLCEGSVRSFVALLPQCQVLFIDCFIFQSANCSTFIAKEPG